MNKTIEPIRRSPWMQEIMTSTYPSVAIEAINGGFDGAWERLIAEQLRIAFKSGNEEAKTLFNLFRNSPQLTFFGISMKAAYLITSSKLETV